MSSEEQLLNKRYRLLAPLGAGGMAVVYKAQDLSLGRLVAIKILREPLTNDPEFVARFQQEARAAANLAHPNIVTVHDFGRDSGRSYIVMEYIEGKDLKTLIKEAGGPLKADKTIDILIQVCAGIGYAHRAGLVHCDVKPQNVLVTPEGRVKITDFGIARALITLKPGEKTDVVWGSPQYYSPEQAAGEIPTPASDVYSIGVMFYEMLAGRLPFVASSASALAMMHLREEPPLVTLFNPGVPETLERIIHKVLAKEPAARYRTADQLGRILISYRERGEGLTTAQPSQGQTPAQPVAEPQPARPPEPASEVLPSTPPIYHAPPTVAHAAAPLPVEMAPRGGEPDDEGLDWLAVGLTFLVVIDIGGLIVLWIVVLARYLR